MAYIFITTKEKTNWKYILIIVILALIVIAETFYLLKQEEKIPEIKLPEKVVKDETADWKTYRDEEYGFEIRYPEDILFIPEQVKYGPSLRSFSTTSIEESPVPDLAVYLENIKVSPYEDAQNKLKDLPVYLEGSEPHEEKIGDSLVYVIVIKLYGGAEGVTKSYYFPKFILSFSFANNTAENKFKNLEQQILSTFKFLE